MRRLVIAALVIGAIVAGRRCCDDKPAQWRAATFNIEHFPKDQRQIDGAFAELATLGADIIAVQEIRDTELFAVTARARLGADWQFVSEHPPDGTYDHQLGVLFDRRAYELVRRRVHDGTSLGGRHKGTLDVELRARETGTALRVLVVHLRCCTEGLLTRLEQHRALRAIVAEVQDAGAPLIVLGDFNATSEADRAELARLAAHMRGAWATEDLPCSAFWDRLDTCPTSRLDHVLTTFPPIETRAAGGCAEVGCDTHDRCPLYEEHVSDHCPVVVTFGR